MILTPEGMRKLYEAGGEDLVAKARCTCWPEERGTMRLAIMRPIDMWVSGMGAMPDKVDVDYVELRHSWRRGWE